MTNISQLIRAAAEEQTTPTTHSIVDGVLRELQPSDYYDALRTLLTAYVSTNIGSYRNAALQRMRQPVEPDRGGSLESEPQTFVDDTVVPQLLRDPKAAAIIDAALLERVPVADGSYKQVRELTIEDVRYVADVRMSQARALTESARSYLRLLGAMEAAGAETVGDLDPKIFRGAMAGAV